MVDPGLLAPQRSLLNALSASLGGACTWHETHISWVLVAGAFAYKFKKALRFDFLDFSTLALRRFYCEEELRLNARFAPHVYLEVVAITGDPARPEIGGEGMPLEYAVKMHAFSQQSLWSHRVSEGLLSGAEVDALAEHVARFHDAAAVASPDSTWGMPPSLDAIAGGTLAQLAHSLQEGGYAAQVAALQKWEARQRAALHNVFLDRKTACRIRECHGDLHCGNILTLDRGVEAFDCIEFNDSLRWIDVMNDIAFACMDLRFRNLAHFAARLLNRYLESTGDYHGLQVFRYYEVHRALIRCKVALLRETQADPGADSARQGHAEALAYLEFALNRIEMHRPAIILTHGLSGSGKSTLARKAVQALGAIQIRSDVERKRLHDLAANERAGEDIYSTTATQRTYERLHQLAKLVAQAGWPVIVDATFLRHAQRQPFFGLAQRLGIPFLILDVKTDEATMRNRIVRRQQEKRDASDAGIEIFERQMAESEPLRDEEMPYVLTADSAMASPLAGLRERLDAAT